MLSPETVADWKPVVRVGIITRNRAEILPKAIRSALSQTYPHARVTVLDDGSEDGTSALRTSFPEVQWLRSESSRGILDARNELMQTADADYYLSLDDDAWFIDKDEIGVAVNYLEGNNRVAAVAFDILSPDHPHLAVRSAPRPVHVFIGCGHVVRLSALRQCGFYAPSPGFYGSEEHDLCIRLLDRNWQVHLLPGVHIWHDKTIVSRDRVAQHRSGVCNDLVFTLRRCPLPMVLGILPYKLLSQLWFAIRKGLFRSYIAGIRLFLRHSITMWAVRDPVRAATFCESVQQSRRR